MAVCQKRRTGHLITIDFQVNGPTPAVRQSKVCWSCGRRGLQVGLQSVPSLGLLSVASMSSSSLLSSDESVLASSKAGVGARAHNFNLKRGLR